MKREGRGNEWNGMEWNEREERRGEEERRVNWIEEIVWNDLVMEHIGREDKKSEEKMSTEM